MVLTLALELHARDMPLRGSLLDLQMQSVAVWVLESLPFLLAFAAAAMARPATAPGAPVSVGLSSEASVSGPGSADSTAAEGGAPRIHALEELVRVLRGNATRSMAESRTKSAYLASLSDELRSPLNDIVGRAEAMLDGVSDGPHEEELRHVHASARYVVDVVNDIVDLSRIEVGSLPLIIEDVDLAQVLDEVRVAVASALAHQKTNLVASVPTSARFVRADHTRTRQVLVNLVRFAMAQTHSKTISVTVQPVVDDSGAWVAVNVHLPNAELDKEQVERVFDEYRATGEETEPTSGGGGLGLALSRKLADLMGGKLLVESGLGQGTTFTLQLERSDIDEGNIAPRSLVALNERLEGLELLMVDNDPSAAGLGTYLSKAGLVVEYADPNATALEAIEGKLPHIAIVGAEVAECWPAAETLVERDVRVVVLSLRDDHVEKALELGVTSFLARPAERRLVLATLERCLDEA